MAEILIWHKRCNEEQHLFGFVAVSLLVCLSLQRAEAEVPCSSLHKFFQLLQTRWTQRLFTIHCSKIQAHFPSSFFDICLGTQPHRHTKEHIEHAEKLERQTHSHTHTHLLFLGTCLHKSHRIPITTHVGKHTCTHTAAASLKPIKWALCV